MLHNTPESLNETLPGKSRSGRYVITSSARLDNREELFRALDVPYHERNNMPDSSLIMRAYEKWEEQCPNHLTGDWMFAIWDIHKRKFFIARDHHGNTGLYYYLSQHLFVFSSCIKGIFALPEIPVHLNELRIAQILVFWPENGGPTAYRDILRLTPAHCMIVTRNNVTLRQYWRLEETPKLHLRSDREYVEAFLEVYAEAVRCRLRSLRPVGVTLSGGLDSGSVAALAAREMRQEGKRLQAFSSVPMYDVEGLAGPNFGDETPFIQATARSAGNIDVTFVRAEDISPLMGIKRFIALFDEPCHAASNAYWIVALLEEAKRRGVGTLLTGQGGNATVSWNGAGYLAQLARKRQWKVIWKEMLALKRLHNRPLWRIVLGRVVKPFIPPRLLGTWSRILSGKEAWEKYSAINRHITDTLNINEQMYLHGPNPLFGYGCHTGKNRFSIIEPGRSTLGFFWQESGMGFGIEVRDPTFDRRVMEFCLSIPDDQYVRKGADRFLIRRAMDGFLPPEVLWNTRKGRQGADIGGRLLKNLDETKSALEKVKSSELARQFLDIGKMSRVLSRLEKEINQKNTHDAGTIFLRGLMAGLFLLPFEKEIRIPGPADAPDLWSRSGALPMSRAW
jgi:asparagine synthase (glutamine-hydrolysing)